MKISRGQFTRQHSDETDGIRETAETPDYSEPEAGFCEVSGKWTRRLIQVGDQKVCKVVADKIEKMAGPCPRCGFPGSASGCLNEKCEECSDYVGTETAEKEEAYEASGLKGKVTLAEYNLAMKAMAILAEAQVTPEDGLDDEMEREQESKDKREKVKEEKGSEAPQEAEG